MGLKHLLIDAKNEIHQLRQRNEILEAQQGVVEVFAAALGFKRNERGMTIDVAHLLGKEIAELEERERSAPRAEATPRETLVACHAPSAMAKARSGGCE